MDIEESSTVGSRDIHLRKNLERGHIYRGLYFIKDSLKVQFEGYSPVPHFKMRDSLFRQLIDGLKDLTRIAMSEDESCEMFVASMYENLGIGHMEQAEELARRLLPTNQFGGNIIYMSVTDSAALKGYLTSYLKLYEWSVNLGSGRPYYSYETYLSLIRLSRTIKEWEDYDG